MALADALHTLLRSPGATYACVVERDSGRVLAEVGHGEAGTGDSEGVVPYSVPRWGTAVAAMFDSTSGDELDDVMVTGRRSYHLLRPLGAGGAVLVYLRLDRNRSNLAAARRELAAVRLAGGVDAPGRGATAAAPVSARAPERSSAPEARPPSATPPPARPAPAARMPASLPPPVTPAHGTRGPVSRPADPEPADPATPTPASGRRGPRARAGTSAGPSAGSEQNRTRARNEARTQARTRALTRAQTESPPDAAPPVPSAVPARALSAGEAGRQIPLPRRAPGRAGAADGPVRRAEPRVWGPGDPVAEPAPEGFAVPAVLGQHWAQDPGTLRRLLAGLRRMA